MRDPKSRPQEADLEYAKINKRTSARRFSFVQVVYTATVRKIRKSHGNALFGLFLSVSQTLLLVGVFYFMFSVLGMRGASIRGDFVLFLMSGIFLFVTFNSAMSAVLSAEGPASPMMLHAPMSPAVAIVSSALASLYTQ
ncbi:MAG: hypothetical protein AAGF71_15085, partial [Pseudomonadota bacterium]